MPKVKNLFFRIRFFPFSGSTGSGNPEIFADSERACQDLQFEILHAKSEKSGFSGFLDLVFPVFRINRFRKSGNSCRFRTGLPRRLKFDILFAKSDFWGPRWSRPSWWGWRWHRRRGSGRGRDITIKSGLAFVSFLCIICLYMELPGVPDGGYGHLGAGAGARGHLGGVHSIWSSSGGPDEAIDF